MVVMTVLAMWYISWLLAAVTLGSLLALTLLGFCLGRRIETKLEA